MPRIKLSEQYKNEREELCKKLIEITGNEFLLSELDENLEKQAAILALKDEIQKCFAVSSISSFKKSLAETVRRDYLNMVRGVLKQQGYIFIGTQTVLKIDDDISKNTQKYRIFRNNS